jgi:four helix bundle protein
MGEQKEKDICERTYKFGVRIVKMTLALPKNFTAEVIGKQVIRSGTSIGANTFEAQGSISKKEFIYSMNIAKREAKETLYWLNIIADSNLLKREQLNDLLNECEQILKILITIIKNSQKQ